MHAVKTASIDYISGTIDFIIEETVIGLTSGAMATVASVTGTTTSGTIILVYVQGSVDFQTGEDLQVGGITNAIASTVPVDGFVQKVTSVGANNHLNGQFIDNKGASVIRFSQGEGCFDSYGNLKIGVDNPISSYIFRYDDREGTDTLSLESIIAGSASKSHSVVTGAVTLTCTTSASDSIKRTSNRYHTNFPGTSRTFIIGAQIGDTGKADCTRRWGYYNDTNGSFFELNGTDLRIVVRTSVTGSTVDAPISQADWNLDVVDGTQSLSNRSSMNLDLSKWNIFFIDTQFMGAAHINFGVYDDDGEKVILHAFTGINTGLLPTLVTAGSPVRYEQFNTGTTASTSQMSVNNIGILTSSEIRNQVDLPHEVKTGFSTGVSITGTDIPVMSMRATDTIGSLANRKPIVPCNISIITDQPILLKWVVNGSLTAPSFAAAGSNILEEDTSASAITGGNIIDAYYLSAGTHQIEISKHFSWLNYYIAILASGAYGDTHSIVMDKAGATNATVSIALKWVEFK
jgi:hypothetical protein